MTVRYGPIGGAGGAGISIGDTVTNGTDGSVLFLGTSNVLAQNNDNFFWDNINNRLGLGTTSPSSEIHIAHSDSKFIIQNTDEENATNGRQTLIAGWGETGAGVVHELGFIEFSHDSLSSDQEGQIRFFTNSGAAGQTANLHIMTLGENKDFSNLASVGVFNIHRISDGDTSIEFTGSDEIIFRAGNVSMFKLSEKAEDNIIFNEGSNDVNITVKGAADSVLLTTDAGLDSVGVGVAVAAQLAKLHVDQNSSTFAKPVLILDQADIDDSFINYIGTSAADGSRSISSDTTEDAAKFGAFRVEINGGTKWVRIYDSES